MHITQLIFVKIVHIIPFNGTLNKNLFLSPQNYFLHIPTQLNDMACDNFLIFKEFRKRWENRSLKECIILVSMLNTNFTYRSSAKNAIEISFFSLTKILPSCIENIQRELEEKYSTRAQYFHMIASYTQYSCEKGMRHFVYKIFVSCVFMTQKSK